MTNEVGYSLVQALSIAGSTFAIGVSLGWIMALLHISGLPGRTNPRHKDE